MSSSMAEIPASHFFQVILPATIQDKKLRIPEKFVRRFGNELTSVATLTVPNGDAWPVGLTKDGGKIWFHAGWHHFVKHYSIYGGCFVVFKYEKNSKFNVHIFDKTTCEIQYLSRNMCTPSQKNQAKSFPCSSRNNTSGTCAATLDSLKFQNGCEMLGKECKVEDMEVMYNIPGSVCSKRHPSKDAENFCPPSPSFDRTKFKRSRHNGKDKNQAEVMRNESELKKDTCKFRRHTSDGLNKRTKFDRDDLSALLESKGICIARIYGRLAVEERKRAISIARLFKPTNPSFMVILSSKSIREYNGHVYVPTKFATKYFSKKFEHIKLQSEGREWIVEVTHFGIGCFIRKGWDKFTKDKNLKEGDICLFELIKRKGVVLKVTIFHASVSK